MTRDTRADYSPTTGIESTVKTISFEQLRAANNAREHEMREKVWAACKDWKLTDWTNALAGEAGECCGITKKMDLMYPAGCYPLTEEQKAVNMVEALGKEIADVVLYADLLASKIGKTLPELLVQKFNEVSERISSSVRL